MTTTTTPRTNFPQGMLAGQTAIITGGAQGIGGETAVILAREGCKAVIADIDGGKAEQTAQNIISEGGSAIAVLGDITKSDAISDLVKKAAEFGGLRHVLPPAATNEDTLNLENLDVNLFIFPLHTYRHGLTRLSTPYQGEYLRGLFNGSLYKDFHIRELGLFSDPHDIALHISLDGVQDTNLKNHEITPIILVNLNLPPDQRYKIENILISTIIPGPRKPKDLNSFLRPLVDELMVLGQSGVSAFDQDSGDGPAAADAMGMKAPGNAFRPCRSCTIAGQRHSTSIRSSYYVPHIRFDFENPPTRIDLRGLIEQGKK